MIVTEQTPKYRDMTVEQAGSLLPEADVVDAKGLGVKVGQDRDRVEVILDSLNDFPQRLRLTPDEARHLAQLLTTHAEAARSW